MVVPKNGPSAGVAMFTAVASLFSERPVRADVAMTGEITLRGLVLPIGGLEEKTLAAERAGVRTVIIPQTERKRPGKPASQSAGIRKLAAVMATSLSHRLR